MTFYTETNPDGRESASPTFYAGEEEHSIEQVLALAAAITAIVETYRAAGGVA